MCKDTGVPPSAFNAAICQQLAMQRRAEAPPHTLLHATASRHTRVLLEITFCDILSLPTLMRFHARSLLLVCGPTALRSVRRSAFASPPLPHRYSGDADGGSGRSGGAARRAVRRLRTSQARGAMGGGKGGGGEVSRRARAVAEREP